VNGSSDRAPRSSGDATDPAFAINYSSVSVLVSDPTRPGYLVGFGAYEGAAVGSNASVSDEFPNGTVGVFVSSNGGLNWSETLLPGNPDYANGSSTLCGFQNDAAVAAAAANGTVVLLVSATPGLATTGCVLGPSGWALELFVSRDGGATWGLPEVVTLQANAPASGPTGHPADVALDPSAATAYVAYPDPANGTFELRLSNTLGSSLSSPIVLLDTAQAGVRLALSDVTVDALTWYQAVPGTSSNHYVAQYALNFLTLSPPGWTASNVSLGRIFVPSLGGFPWADLASARSAGSPYNDLLYAVWTNGSALGGGSPAVVLSESDNAGGTWSEPANLSGAASASQCCAVVAMGENGSVVVAWYGTTAGPYSKFRLSASVSFDRGGHFSPEFGADGWTGNGTNALQTPAVAPLGNSAEVLWTQYRSATPVTCGACPGGEAADREVDRATVVVGTIASTSPTNLSVSGIATEGATLAVGPAPLGIAGIGGNLFTVTAPASFVVGGVTHFFSEWFGSVDSSSPALTTNWAVGTNLTACFVSAQGAPCQAPGAPGTLSVTVVPPTALVTANGLGISLHLGHGTILLPSGSAEVVAEASAYATFTTNVSITPGTTTVLNLTLVLLPGVLEGNVTPADARVTVDGAGISVAPNGSFFEMLPTGAHQLAAFAYGYFSYTGSVVLSYGAPTVRDIVLVWDPAHVVGGVTPTNASVFVDGVPVNVSDTGSFFLTLQGGSHLFTASAWRYQPLSMPVELEPSQYVPVGLHLTPSDGTLRAVISPSTAAVKLDGQLVATDNGVLEMSIPWGFHQLAASASGYSPAQAIVNISYGSVTDANLTLGIAPGWIAGSVAPANASILVDGAPVNVSDNGSFNVTVAVGAHLLVANASGYEARTFGFLVQAGESNRTQIALVPNPATSAASMTRPLTLGMLADGLALDAAVLLGVAVLYLVARRHR